MSRFRTLTAALTATALTLLPVTAAHADPAQYSPTMLILDASGSMQRPDQGATMMGLAYRVRFTETGGAGYTNSTNVTTTVYSPVGGQVDEDTNSHSGRQATDLEGATVPIRYANRDASETPVQQQSVAGWYYIAVKVGMPSGTTAMPPTPVELDRRG
ncbi:hypothetical protein [Nocardia sp. NPDC058497]|uniref:hypothetical protein n=1 Tax=Nocardia sp. NPDC058497 TaxID=3346529 RepID=UPI00366984B2